jgi:hypothetical protein
LRPVWDIARPASSEIEGVPGGLARAPRDIDLRCRLWSMSALQKPLQNAVFLRARN